MRISGLGIIRLIRAALSRPPAPPVQSPVPPDQPPSIGPLGVRPQEAGVGGAAAESEIVGLCRSWRSGGLALILLCFAVYLPGLWSIPPVDRDESRFAQASRQMYESGDFVVPRVQDKPRLNKPPLIYWLQCASIAVFGDKPGQYANGNIWVFRVPSILAAMASVLMTWRLGLRMLDARAALLGAAFLAVCPMVVWDAHQARADQVLLATVIATQWALFEVWGNVPPDVRLGGQPVRSGWVAPISFWLALALGILTKGPIAPMIAALTIISLSIWNRDARWLLRLRPLLGIVILAAVVGPWVYAVGERAGWAEYWSVVKLETLGRSTQVREGHWGLPGYHLVMFCVLFWPGTLLTGLAVIDAWRKPRQPDGAPSAERFLLCWAVPMWVVFELILTKLPHYMMPLYPALALLSGHGVFTAQEGLLKGITDRPSRIGFALWIAIGAVVIVGFPVALTMPYFPRDLWTAAVFVPGIALIAWFVLRPAATALRNGLFVRASALAIVIGFVLWAALLGLLVPGANVWVSTEILDRLSMIREREDHRPFAAVGYQEDSLVFLTRGMVDLIEESQILEWLEREHHEHGVVVVPQELANRHAELQPVESIIRFSQVGGFNYARGRYEWLILVEKHP